MKTLFSILLSGRQIPAIILAFLLSTVSINSLEIIQKEIHA
jgi:hypothetical protein